MKKILLLVLLLIIGAGAYAWFSVQSLPNWFDDQEPQEKRISQQLSQRIQNEGVAKFLGNKFADVLNGQVVLSEAEFNAIFLASLKANEDGRKLLAVSDAVNAKLRKGRIEIGAVINLDKVEKIDAKARKAVERVSGMFPFLSGSRMSVSVVGEPIARNGQIGIKDNFSAKVGAIPLSNSTLRKLGAKVERANSTNLAIKYLSIQFIDVQDGQISMRVLPRF